MFWIGFKKIKFIGLFLTAMIFNACLSEEGNKEAKEEPQETLTKKERLVRQIENELDISAAEEYDMQVYPEFINADTLKDKLVLVNRKEFAYKHVKEQKSEAFFERTGHTAPFNYVFVQMGDEEQLLSTDPVGSNVDYPIDAHFVSLTAKARKDFYVDYRIKNSMQRNYYTVRNNRIYKTFSCPVFDSIGADNPVVYAIKHKENSMRLAKDIVLYKGEITDYNPSEIQNKNNFTPKDIVSTETLFAYFIFDKKRMKYVTPMKPK